jgi:hypothetical protein
VGRKGDVPRRSAGLDHRPLRGHADSTNNDQISTYGKKAANRPMARASRIVKVSKRLGHKTDILYDETCNAAGSFRLDAQRADGPAY